MTYNFRKRKLRLWVKFTILLLVVLSVAIIINAYCKPIIMANAKNQASNIISEAVDCAVYEELSENNIAYDNLVHIERSQNNDILSIQTNTVQANKLKSAINMNIQDRLSQRNNSSYSISLGTLTGMAILQGVGWDINFQIDFLSDISNNIKSEFISVGINQTKHLVYLEVHSSVKLNCLGYDEYNDIVTNVYIAETVIVGDVPNVYSDSEKENLNIADLNSLNGS